MSQSLLASVYIRNFVVREDTGENHWHPCCLVGPQCQKSHISQNKGLQKRSIIQNPNDPLWNISDNSHNIPQTNKHIKAEWTHTHTLPTLWQVFTHMNVHAPKKVHRHPSHAGISIYEHKGTHKHACKYIFKTYTHCYNCSQRKIQVQVHTNRQRIPAEKFVHVNTNTYTYVLHRSSSTFNAHRHTRLYLCIEAGQWICTVVRQRKEVRSGDTQGTLVRDLTPILSWSLEEGRQLSYEKVG